MLESDLSNMPPSARATHVVQTAHTVSKSERDSLTELIESVQHSTNNLYERIDYVDNHVQELRITANRHHDRICGQNEWRRNLQQRIDKLEQCMADMTQFFSLAPKFHKEYPEEKNNNNDHQYLAGVY